MSIKQTVCIFVALGIQHTMRMRHVFICGLPRSSEVFHIIGTIFKEKKFIDCKMHVLSFSTSCVRNFFHSKKN